MTAIFGRSTGLPDSPAHREPNQRERTTRLAKSWSSSWPNCGCGPRNAWASLTFRHCMSLGRVALGMDPDPGDCGRRVGLGDLGPDDGLPLLERQDAAVREVQL